MNSDTVYGWRVLGILVAVILVGWAILSFFGVSFGVESEGTVDYSDCRQTITIQDYSWQAYTKKFICNYSKTVNGEIMGGECAHIVNDSSFFGSSHTCATAYIYEKKPFKECTTDYPYLWTDGNCWSSYKFGSVYDAPGTI